MRKGYIVVGTLALAGFAFATMGKNAIDSYYSKQNSINQPAIVQTITTNALEKKVAMNRFSESKVKEKNSSYSDFLYKKEIPTIAKHSKRLGIDPKLIMAIRRAENGKSHIAYGVIPQNKIVYNNDMGYFIGKKFYHYKNEGEKQLCWAVNTVKNYLTEFQKKHDLKEDFISYLAKRYSPTEGDELGLNKNWEKNVRHYYNEFKGKN